MIQQENPMSSSRESFGRFKQFGFDEEKMRQVNDPEIGHQADVEFPILSDNQLKQLTFELLDDPLSWRVRAVEEIQLTRAQWAERSRVIEISPLGEALQGSINSMFDGTEGEPKSLDLILPISEFPKTPLLDFIMTVDGEAVQRIPRKKGSVIQAEYIYHLARRAGVTVPSDENLYILLACIFGFRPGAWERMIKGRKVICRSRALRLFLRRCANRAIELEKYKHWKKVLVPKFENLVRKHVVLTRSSAAQNPLLALPSLFRRVTLDDDEVGQLLDKLYNFLDDSEKKFRDPDADPHERECAGWLVSTYCAYGRRWEAMARCTVPLDRPFTITVRDRRMIRFDSPKKGGLRFFTFILDRVFSTTRHYVSSADAQSNHLHIVAPDSSVEFVPRSCKARDEVWKKLPCSPSGVGQAPEDEQKTVEHYSRYDSRSDRPFRIWVQCRLRQSLLRWCMTWGVILATVSAIFLIVRFNETCGYSWLCAYDASDKMNGGDVVAILLPVTFAASLLLARDVTTLGVRVKRAVHLLLMFVFAALWGITVYFYVVGHICIGS
ncbi:hypothetical protein AB0478_30715 [Streptomyces sp. NPDC051917]|uniref:hypothetical protein n=1 Tax=Streptomyces sp. NPDC051917 TaxID=3154754 RepID=UPI00344CA58A